MGFKHKFADFIRESSYSALCGRAFVSVCQMICYKPECNCKNL